MTVQADKSDALVLIPGLMSDAALWQAQIDVLQAKVSIQVVDHQQFDSIEAMAANVLNHAPARFALAGHSMGGRVALEVMRQAPERVIRLALISTACHAIANAEAAEKEREARYGFLKLAEAHGLDFMARRWVMNMVHPDRLMDEELINGIAQMFVRLSIATYAAQIKALLNRHELFSVLKNIHCPTLVLGGREDTSAPVAVHEEMVAELPNTNLVIVERCGHMSTLEQPARVTVALQQWLQK